MISPTLRLVICVFFLVFNSTALNASSFLRTCLNENAPDDQKHTISVLKTMFKQPDCRLLYRLLLSQKTLNLSSQKITDISPLKSLAQLIKLNLKDNEIESIAALRRLSLLQDLNLSYP